jgi:hypothetical protein
MHSILPNDHQSPDRVQATLARRIAELDPLARRLRAALLSGVPARSLGLVEDGLAAALAERRISRAPHAPRKYSP